MNIIIENEYKNEILSDYENIIISVINETVDYVKCPYECEVNVTIVDNDSIRDINFRNRNMNQPTDVLSFPLLEFKKPSDFSGVEDNISNFNPDSGELLLGDIVISYDKVQSQAKEYNHSLKREIAFLTAHSMLHLFGYDHIKEDERRDMEEIQNHILKNLGITRDI